MPAYLNTRGIDRPKYDAYFARVLDVQHRMTGEEIRQLREALQWSQRQLADFLGIEQATVSRLEAGLWLASGPVQKLLEGLRAQAAERLMQAQAAG